MLVPFLQGNVIIDEFFYVIKNYLKQQNCHATIYDGLSCYYYVHMEHNIISFHNYMRVKER